jgi:hypothetical protein
MNMRAYEHFLGALGGFLKVAGLSVFLVALVAGVIYAIASTNVSEEIREVNLEAKAWCLDNGGRTMKIDGVRGCFQLSEVELEVGFWDSKQSECQRNPSLVWIRPPNGNTRYCYSYKRLVQEN